jgi:hypothetical protein
MTEQDYQEEEQILTAYEKFQVGIEKAKELTEKIADKALSELALRESMGNDLEGLVENLEKQGEKLFGAPEIEGELEPVEDLDPSHPEYVQPPLG